MSIRVANKGMCAVQDDFCVRGSESINRVNRIYHVSVWARSLHHLKLCQKTDTTFNEATIDDCRRPLHTSLDRRRSSPSCPASLSFFSSEHNFRRRNTFQCFPFPSIATFCCHSISSPERQASNSSFASRKYYKRCISRCNW